MPRYRVNATMDIDAPSLAHAYTRFYLRLGFRPPEGIKVSATGPWYHADGSVVEPHEIQEISGLLLTYAFTEQTTQEPKLTITPVQPVPEKPRPFWRRKISRK